MSDIIRLLPDSVANQIAAGEVIQRPASVIKELVENAVDAGAKTVSIILKDAGRTLIQVVDDGSGMSDTDARLAFERHATSKIQNAADLFSLRTMGFRGEALASIAAIAQLDVRTMLHGSTVGTRLLINGSKVESQVPEACAPGTNLMVKNLFFNVPARRKFLKKDAVEMSNILHEFERMALVNPDVELNLTHNDQLLHNLRRGSLKQRIGDLFGKNLEKQLIGVDTSTSIITISGFVGLPENARRRSPLQYLMVNGRNMRHPYFHKAIMTCYEGLIAPDAQPNYFINMTVDPQTIDVNIHPTKNEIKFENESAIWQILTAAVRESLGRFNGTPGMDFEAVDMIDIPAFDPDASARHDINIDPDYNPFKQATKTSQFSSSYQSQEFQPQEIPDKDWEKLFDDFTRKREQGLQDVVNSSINDRIVENEIPSFSDTDLGALQLNGKFIVTPVKDGLMVIDQHRAHVTVLYNQYREQVKRHEVGIQKSIFPDLLTLSPSQNAVLETLLDLLPQAGFELEKEGNNQWAIVGSPAMLQGITPKDLLAEMIEKVSETGEDPLAGFQERLARTMAEKGAIRYGQVLNQKEMSALITNLLRLSSPSRTFDGKKVLDILPISHFSHFLG